MIVRLNIDLDMHSKIWTHLLPNLASTEEAGFGYANFTEKDGHYQFNLKEWEALYDEDFDFKEGDYLQLKDESRARVIKRAHCTDTCLVEFHSHPFPFKAKFSYADKVGLKNFVPHVWWRLKNRPYIAIVVAPDSFDGLVWLDNPYNPENMSEIYCNEVLDHSTGLSIDYWRKDYEY